MEPKVSGKVLQYKKLKGRRDGNVFGKFSSVKERTSCRFVYIKKTIKILGVHFGFKSMRLLGS